MKIQIIVIGREVINASRVDAGDLTNTRMFSVQVVVNEIGKAPLEL